MKLKFSIALGAFALATLPAFSDDTNVSPQTYTIMRGTLVSGTLQDVFQSDDHYLVVQDAASAYRGDSPITVLFQTVCTSQTPTHLHFLAENRVSISGLTQGIDFFDWTTSSYTNLDSSEARRSDHTISLSIDDPSHFVQRGSNAMTARFRIFSTGPVYTYTWLTYIDQIQWIVSI